MSIIKGVEEGLIALKGEVDMHSSNTLRRELLAQTKKKTDPLVIDMADVSYIDSSGLATLIEGNKLAKAYSGTLTLRGTQPKVMAVFKLAHLIGFFDFED